MYVTSLWYAIHTWRNQCECVQCMSLTLNILQQFNLLYDTSPCDSLTIHYYPQPVQGLPSIQGWQALYLPVWKYSGTDQQHRTCGPSCTSLTGRMEHLQWETQQTQMGPCQVWRQRLSIQWPSLPSLTAQCVQSSRSILPSTQHRVSDDGSENHAISNEFAYMHCVNFIILMSYRQWVIAWYTRGYPIILSIIRHFLSCHSKRNEQLYTAMQDQYNSPHFGHSFWCSLHEIDV